MHPSDSADLIENLVYESRAKLIELEGFNLDPEIFIELNESIQEEIFIILSDSIVLIIILMFYIIWKYNNICLYFEILYYFNYIQIKYEIDIFSASKIAV